MPALAIGRAVTEMHPDWRVVYAGARRGLEATVLPDRGVPHHLLPLEPIYRQQWWKNARWAYLVPMLIARIDAMLDAERPDVVIGTGGYASGPVVWRAARRGIPTGILDVDVRPGIATRWLSTRVREVWTGAPESIDALPRRARARVRVTGAPIVPPDPERRATAFVTLGVPPRQPVLVITGGSQGSLALNRLVAAWLAEGGAAGCYVIWITGRKTFDEFASLVRLPHVRVIAFQEPMADAWAVADLVVARSGMMTLAEVCAWGLPSVLIPLPTAAADHQTHNALAAVNAGAAEMLAQASLTSARLGAVVDALLRDPARRHTMAAAARARARPDAAAVIAARISALASTTP